MTKQFFTSISRTFLSGILVFQLLSIPSKTNANFNINGEIKRGIADSTQNKFIVKYKGIIEDNLEFDVTFLNSTSNTFFFLVKDENNEVIFEKQYQGKSFSKRIQMQQLGGYTKISFTIVTDKGNILSTKQINISTKIIEDIEVHIN